MAYETILYERKGRIAYITLNRPDRLNAVTDQMAGEIIDAVHQFDSDPEAWLAIVSGSGRCFCSGADVHQRQLRPREEILKYGRPAAVRPPGGGLGLSETVNWKPAIAAVHGYAIGVGLAMAWDCDLVVAAEGTKFQIREIQRGVGGGPLWTSTWFWGGGRFANEVSLTDRKFTAEEGLRLGMFNRVVPPDQLMPAAEALAAEVLANPPLSVRANVRVSRWYARQVRRDAEMYEQGLHLHLTEDYAESARAFAEKRQAVFQGK